MSLCLTKHLAMNTYWGVEIWFHAFLTSAPDGGEWSASRTGRLTLGERTLGTHWIGGWMGPRAGLAAVAKREIQTLCLTSNPDRPLRSLVSIPTELSRLLLYKQKHK